jgi:uncharacterized protein
MNTVVQIFARPPVPGHCKRRLISALGAAGAAALHERMVVHTLAGAMDSGADSVELWFAPDEAGSPGLFLEQLATQQSIELHCQRGDDLGARMYAALSSARDRSAAGVLVGTDCPGHAQGLLREVVTRMAGGASLLFRPAHDGGYVCVGATDAPAELFGKQIPWGTEDVMSATRQILIQLDRDYIELAPAHDVDEPADICHVPKEWLQGLPLDC